MTPVNSGIWIVWEQQGTEFIAHVLKDATTAYRLAEQLGLFNKTFSGDTWKDLAMDRIEYRKSGILESKEANHVIRYGDIL